MTYANALSEPHPAKLTVDDFLLLDRSGTFETYAKTELIDGTIIVVNAEYAEHFKLKNRLYRRIADACDRLGAGVQAWSEGSISIAPHSVPQPDIFVTRVEPQRGLVAVDTVLIAIEVAVSSLEQDLGLKQRLYAKAGIQEYWVVDVEGRVIHQMWEPAGDAYSKAQRVAFDRRIEAVAAEGLTVETRDLS